jgi:uncharacterized membrane protein YbhN (UPF0104 family)
MAPGGDDVEPRAQTERDTLAEGQALAEPPAQADRHPQGGGGEQAERERALAAPTRRLRTSVISLAVFCVLVAALLAAVPGLRSAGERVTDASLGWVAAGIGLELLSCICYVVLFELAFDMLSRGLAQLLALSELAVNSVVSASGLGGLALGAWVLRRQGVPGVMIARRSVLIFVLTSAVNVAAVIVIGVPMWLGLLHGSTNPRLTLLPAAAAAAAIAGTLALAAFARRIAVRSRLPERAADLLIALSDGVVDSVREIRRHSWRLWGAVGYWLFDNLVLYAALRGFGSAPTVWVVFMAYLVGMLANSLPIPGGFIAVEGGLVGMLVLFKVRPASEVLAAVLIYRAISLWIPALVGSVAFLRLRRRLVRPVAAGATG